MSAPTSAAPLVVNTRDGMCWTRRTVTSSGIALYAPEGVCACPEFVMATLPELAELGISGSADALPMPVGPEAEAYLAPSPSCTRCYGADAERFVAKGGATSPCRACGPSELERLRVERGRYRTAWRMARTRAISTGGAADRYAARARDAQEALQHMLFAVIGSQLARRAAAEETAQLRAEVEALRAERHSTNEALDDAVQELRRREAGPALPWAHTMPDGDLSGFLNDLVSAAVNRWQSDPEVPDRETLAAVEKACAAWRTPGQGYRSDEDGHAEEPPLLVFRVSHDSIVMGLYTTAAAAREHCETELRRELPSVALDWIEDEEDGVAELVAMTGGEETETGYVVTALEVASAYDPDAAE